MTINFECLYFLDSEQLCIIEIKINNLPADAPKKDKFKWLLINKKTLSIKTLQFRSMDSSHEIEERFFDLGYLKFDAQKGVYISKEPTTQYQLENTDGQPIPDVIKEAVSLYLI
ncbi:MULTISPECIES: hypothetical protein [Pedobacter]|uniref:Uncharacterized protein n=1 Tax=Pedobacter heparinus (strain ATCC 13125 / DSM 2366 / CIP 104194 / JCM 7457 / NBRC 12017 / NCIMB 9290 / NRRL B-14731 / HIM 762-3) TaxID=485917 RepID=C6Y421_PEDHD|nr:MULTISPECIES: hypothetical protein [Pedobacter]ACU05464.1 hypothetical protein Phep_3269 [Pedobacter heparinus DSM 2366]MBB5440573.1 hypothetical protein [Pedobacter sp. AK017]